MLSLTPMHITGGRRLSGEYAVQPSKNAALPIIVAALLSRHPVTLHGIPRLSDIFTILDIVSQLGARHAWVGPNSVTLHTPELTSTETPYALVSKMRASFIVMGALIARGGEARVSMPGGCAFGHRPVDQHVKAFRAFGLHIDEDGGNFQARRLAPMTGRYAFEMLTVGATQNAILAAALGEGQVVLENASIDTDVLDMVNFLNSLGANIAGAGTHTITVTGVSELRGGEYRIIPDRIEAGTLMIAAAATRSRLTLTGVRPEHLRALSAKLSAMGADVTETADTVTVDALDRELHAVDIETAEFPAFPTDIQPQMSALLATVTGSSQVSDTVYTDRLTHVAELKRMGADISVTGHTQTISGGALHGAQVKAADIRAGAALVVAALAAQGETTIEGMVYLNRGYERFAERLQAIGAQVRQSELALAADD